MSAFLLAFVLVLGAEIVFLAGAAGAISALARWSHRRSCSLCSRRARRGTVEVLRPRRRQAARYYPSDVAMEAAIVSDALRAGVPRGTEFVLVDPERTVRI